MEMMNIGMWKFSKIPMAEELIFNPLVKHFYQLGIDTLVKENIQNSLDGKIKESNNPVEVIINLGTTSTNVLPGIEEIRERIKTLSGHNEETISTIKHMKKTMTSDIVPYISFEDRNTKGLTGARRGYNYEAGDTYGIYAYQKGVHNVDSDEAIESIRGGSHGVGKIASNAASNIHLMYFANCDGTGNKHLGGTVQLIEHKYNNKNYRATGYFTDEKENVFYPYNNEFDKIFEKNTRGLKIVIPFLQELYNDKSSVIRAVCDNFFMAILENKLVVQVNDVKVDQDTIFNILKDPSIYKNQEIEMLDKNFTSLYVNTYLNESTTIIKISDLNTEYNFRLYCQYNEAIKRGRVAIVRRIGMKIEDFKVTNHSKTSFNAVLIPESDKEDIFLKLLENESHTKLSAEHIKDPKSLKNAKRFIYNLHKRLAEYISEMIRQANPTDGAIDTKDLLYSVEHNFKKILSKQMTTVEISKGNSPHKRRLVKTVTNKYEEKKTSEKEKKEKTREGTSKNICNVTRSCKTSCSKKY